MSILASTLCLSAIAAAGDIEFSGVGQTVVTSLDGVETLDTRLVLGAYGESEGAVYGFAFETNDNLDDTTLWEAYVGADLGGVDVTVGRFQRNFSAELAMSEYTYGVGLTNSSVFGLGGIVVDGVSFGGDIGDASFSFDIVGDDVFGDSVTYGGRVELGALGFGFIGEEMEVWTVDISDESGFISYTDDNGDWTAVLREFCLPWKIPSPVTVVLNTTTLMKPRSPSVACVNSKRAFLLSLNMMIGTKVFVPDCDLHFDL